MMILCFLKQVWWSIRYRPRYFLSNAEVVIEDIYESCGEVYDAGKDKRHGRKRKDNRRKGLWGLPVLGSPRKK